MVCGKNKIMAGAGTPNTGKYANGSSLFLACVEACVCTCSCVHVLFSCVLVLEQVVLRESFTVIITPVVDNNMATASSVKTCFVDVGDEIDTVSAGRIAHHLSQLARNVGGLDELVCSAQDVPEAGRRGADLCEEAADAVRRCLPQYLCDRMPTLSEMAAVAIRNAERAADWATKYSTDYVDRVATTSHGQGRAGSKNAKRRAAASRPSEAGEPSRPRQSSVPSSTAASSCSSSSVAAVSISSSSSSLMSVLSLEAASANVAAQCIPTDGVLAWLAAPNRHTGSLTPKTTLCFAVLASCCSDLIDVTSLCPHKEDPRAYVEDHTARKLAEQRINELWKCIHAAVLAVDAFATLMNPVFQGHCIVTTNRLVRVEERVHAALLNFKWAMAADALQAYAKWMNSIVVAPKHDNNKSATTDSSAFVLPSGI